MIDEIKEMINDNKQIIYFFTGFVILLLTILIKKTVAKGILNMLSHILYGKNEEKKSSLEKSLLKPISTLLIATGIFISVFINYRSDAILHAFKISVILILCWALFKYLSGNLHFLIRFDNDNEIINATAIKFISNILKVLIVAFAVVMIISELGYNINGLIAGIGVGGLAISLAAQDLVSNLISGLIIVIDKPFVVGDFIECKSVTGTVIEVSMRSSKIRALDDSVVTVPNKEIANDAVINISKMDKRMIDIEFGLKYSTSNELLDKCRSDIKAYLIENEHILPAPLRVEFDRFEESQLELNVFCYTDITDIHKYKEFLSTVNLTIKRIIEENGAEFAFPSRNVYIEKQTS